MTEEMQLPVSLSSEGQSAPGELYSLTLALRKELLNQPVSSVEHTQGKVPEGAAKGIGPNEIQLLITLGSQVLPAIILLLSNWLLRQKDQRLHIKIGDAEADIPRGMKPEEVEQIIKTLTKASKKAK